MTETKKYAAAGFVLAALFATMFFDAFYGESRPGINVPLMTCAYYGAAAYVFRGRLDLRAHRNWVLLLFVAADAMAFVLFDNRDILFLNGVALPITIAIQTLLMTGRYMGAALEDSFARQTAFAVLIRPFHRFGAAYRAYMDAARGGRRVLGVIVGLIIAVPVVGLVAFLLASADRVFELLIFDSLLAGADSELFHRVLLWLIMAAVAAGIAGSFFISLGTVEWKSPLKPEKAEEKTPRRAANIIPVFVVVGALDIVLLLFAGIQVVYLSGMAALPDGVTYSSYAREGFFQLCAVAAICFLVTMASMAASGRAERGARRACSVLLTILCIGTFMLLISAFTRMVLYEQAYMFTRLRVYTQAFMIMLALGLGALVWKLWRPEMRLFGAAYLICCLCLTGLTYFNVDAFIAKNNAPRADKEITMENAGMRYPTDFDYLYRLSADAIPFYIDYIEPEDLDAPALKSLDREKQAVYDGMVLAAQARRAELYVMLMEEESQGIFGWNASRSAAASLIREKLSLSREELLPEKATPEEPPTEQAEPETPPTDSPASPMP